MRLTSIEQRLESDLAMAKLTAEAMKATVPDVIRAAEDAAYETAARKLEEYAQAKLAGVAYSATVVSATIVRLLKAKDEEEPE